MKRFLALSFLLALWAIITPETPSAQSAQVLTLDGDIAAPKVWSADDFKNLPHTTIKVKRTSGGEDEYSGVDLADLLTAGGVPLRTALKGADVAKYLHAEGIDGFVAVFALPEFDGGPFLVADAVNGAALPPDSGPLQIISPQEARHSRWIKHVTLLRIKKSVR
jgi:DMSO/TMAO reductase YedYZ molybdopterin-dependent catalytic subunit